jgi:hypothetical protein
VTYIIPHIMRVNRGQLDTFRFDSALILNNRELSFVYNLLMSNIFKSLHSEIDKINSILALEFTILLIRFSITPVYPVTGSAGHSELTKFLQSTE